MSQVLGFLLLCFKLRSEKIGVLLTNIVSDKDTCFLFCKFRKFFVYCVSINPIQKVTFV